MWLGIVGVVVIGEGARGILRTREGWWWCGGWSWETLVSSPAQAPADGFIQRGVITRRGAGAGQVFSAVAADD